jgi:hypothetical protein
MGCGRGESDAHPDRTHDLLWRPLALLTLRVYAHLMPSEERNLSFASFGPTGTARHNQTAPDGTGHGEGDSADDLDVRNGPSRFSA